MLEFMEALGNTFSHLRARATRGRKEWSRKNKNGNRTRSMSSQAQDIKYPITSPQLPVLQLPTSGLDDSYCHVGEPGAEEKPAQLRNDLSETGLHQHSSGEEQTEDLTKEDVHGTLEVHPQELVEQSQATMNGKSHVVKSPPEPALLSANEILVEQQKDVSAKRLQVRESRVALRYKREEELRIRAKLMKDLNSLFLNQSFPNAEPILRGYELLQAATQEYLSMENTYHKEEDQLEEQEYRLTLSMERFAGLSGNGPLPDIQESAGLWEQQQPDRDSLQETPSCVVNYLTRIGDERMFQERLSDIESEWFIAIEKRDQRNHLQMPLDKDSEEFLQTFDEERLKIWRDLNNAQLDVNELRIICIEQGHRDFDYEDLSSLHQFMEETVFEKNKDPLKLSLQEEFTFSPELQAIDQDPEQPSHHYPLDLDSDHEGTPVENLSFFRELERTKGFGSAEFINKWMLHQLRISSMGIWQLQLLLDWQILRDQGWQDSDISQHALDEWFSDAAVVLSSSDGSDFNNDNRSEIFTVQQEEHIKSQSLPSLGKPEHSLGQRRYSIC